MPSTLHLPPSKPSIFSETNTLGSQPPPQPHRSPLEDRRELTHNKTQTFNIKKLDLHLTQVELQQEDLNSGFLRHRSKLWRVFYLIQSGSTCETHLQTDNQTDEIHAEAGGSTKPKFQAQFGVIGS